MAYGEDPAVFQSGPQVRTEKGGDFGDDDSSDPPALAERVPPARPWGTVPPITSIGPLSSPPERHREPIGGDQEARPGTRSPSLHLSVSKKDFITAGGVSDRCAGVREVQAGAGRCGGAAGLGPERVSPHL